MLQWMLHRVLLMRLYAVMGAPIRSGPYSGKPWTNLPELKAASARRRQAVLAPCPPRPCHRNSTKPFSFMELTSLEYGHRLCPEVRRPVGRAGKGKSLRPCKRTKAKKTLRCTTCYLRTNIRAPYNGGHRQGLLSALWCSACSSGGIFRLPRYFLRALTIPESLQGSADPTVSIIAIVIGFV